MSRVMQVSASDDVWEKAQRALHEELGQGRIPLRWTIGRETLTRLKATVGPLVRDYLAPVDKLLGVPFTVKRDGPPDLLELDVF